MKKLHFSIRISAAPEKVWQTVIGKDTYPLWTEVFMPGSNVQGSWEKGAKILFTGPGENGTPEGMVSEIAENKPHEFLSIKHIGILVDGKEDTTSPAAKAWAPAYENYTLKPVGNETEFHVDIDTDDSFVSYMEDTWPKALATLKEIAETGKSSTIGIGTWVKAPIEKVWEYYTAPEHIKQWAFASRDWEAPEAENDVRVGGKFKTTMAAKDKSKQFDFTGVYTQVKPKELLEYKMDDGRMVTVRCMPGKESVHITTVFDMEHENSRELQKSGWQAILDNFKKHVETA